MCVCFYFLFRCFVFLRGVVGKEVEMTWEDFWEGRIVRFSGTGDTEATMWVLGLEPGSSGRATSARNS